MGDDEDFARFMVAALPGLLRFGRVLTGDALRGEELVQQALVATWSRWGRLDIVQPHAYVRRAMVNAHTSWWRRAHRESQLPEDWDGPDADGTDAGERDRTLRALRTLPPRQRAVLVLRYYEDLSETEISAVLGCSRGAVKSHASRALRNLRPHLEPTPDLERTAP